MPMKNPPHPGHSIKDACLDPLRLSVTEGAKVLGVALKLRLDGKALRFLDRVPGDEHLLGRLQNVGVLGGEVAARRPGAGHKGQPEAGDRRQHQPAGETLTSHGPVLSEKDEGSVSVTTNAGRKWIARLLW